MASRPPSPQRTRLAQETRERFLIGMMKVNFLKRLESSVYSFAITMDRTVKKIEDLEDRIHQFEKLKQSGEFEIQSDLFQGDAEEDEELRALFEVGTVGYKLEHIDIPRWLADLGTGVRRLLPGSSVGRPRLSPRHHHPDRQRRAAW